jgi:hypothetical protein
MINLPIVRMSRGYSLSISMVEYERGAIVGVGVETGVESALFDPNDRKSAIRIGMARPPDDRLERRDAGASGLP